MAGPSPSRLCRPHLFSRLLTFVLFWAFPDPFSVLQAMGIVMVLIVELILWDPRPRYVPKRLRTSWDLSILSHYWKSWLS